MKGRRYVLIQNDARFETHNLWLVTLADSEMRFIELVQRLQKAVDDIVREKRPVSYDRFSPFFPIADRSESNQRASFDLPNASIPFSAEVPKSFEESVDGRITISLPDGKVVKASSDTKRDDPFKDDPELAKADAELNRVYAELRRALDEAARETLKTEQRAWIEKRNTDAHQAFEESQDVENVESMKHRNQSLLKSTVQRTGELKARIKSRGR